MTTMSAHQPSPHWGDYGDRTTARRAAARQHHPDVGGSAAELTAALAAIDQAYGSQDVVITIVHRGVRARARALVAGATIRSAMALNDIRIRVRRIAGAARSDVHGVRRARSTTTSLEDQS